ncbi:MAG: DNA mismatch repair protein MutS [Alphaproteobacteria bacterium]|nr:DNA mismatch repair protein MutS [Alphaproteobacteria bacterium]
MTRRKFGNSLSENEKILWNRVTENIARLDSNRAATPLVRKSAYTVRITDPPYHHQTPSVMATEYSYSLKDADYNWHQKLRRGRVRPEGRIDLHGLTGDQAYSALCRYIETAYDRGKRLILVITGKGGAKPGARGVLKSRVPEWLSQPPLARLITSFHTARGEHGGGGALYVVVKRNREKPQNQKVQNQKVQNQKPRDQKQWDQSYRDHQKQ